MSYEAWGDNDENYASVEQLLEDGWRSGDDLSQAMHDVIDERLRQQDQEGWTPEHDDEHDRGEMARAAACYALPAWARGLVFAPGDTVLDRIWPWHRQWWKPTSRRRDLVKAAALIVAEIERLDRAEQSKEAKGA